MGTYTGSTPHEAGSSRLTIVWGHTVAKSNWVEAGSSRLAIAMGTHYSKIKLG